MAIAAVVALMLGLLVVVGSGQPPVRGVPGVVCASAEAGVTEAGVTVVAGFDDRQMRNAAAIVAAGQELGVPQRGWVVATATAMQEADLLVLGNSTVPESLVPEPQGVGSDHDSVGLFQQRGEGWGPLERRMDPRGSALSFYDTLLSIPNWENLPLTEAAQRVQVSAFPDAYAKWEDEASQVVGAVAGITCPAGGAGTSAASGPLAAQVVERALAQIGTPYAWGGGDAAGATLGIPLRGVRSSVPGYDCSGLMVFAFAGIGVSVPHQTQAIWARFAPPITDYRDAVAGDMLLFSDNGTAGGIHHVGLYLGDGQMVHAPRTGTTVQIEQVWDSSYYSGQFIGAVRAVPAGDVQAP